MAKHRRTFTPEFKVQAVKFVTEQGRSVAEVARDLDLSESDGLLRQGVVMRYGFVERHRGRWPVRLMSRVLGVSPGGYYGWRGGPASRTAPRRVALVVAIQAVHGGAKAHYGSPRVHSELVVRGQRCCENSVANPMGVSRDRRQDQAEVPVYHRLEPRPPRRRECPGSPVRAGGGRPGLGGRHHVRPDARGVAGPGAVEDLHSRRIVGWSTSERIDSRLVVDALEMAIARRLPAEGSWPTPIRAVSTPASTTTGSCRPTGSRAACAGGRTAGTTRLSNRSSPA